MKSGVSSTPIVEISDLRLSYVTGTNVLQAVRGASLAIHTGEAVGLVGESGSGKSTLARSLLGLNDNQFVRVDGGSVSIQGRDVTRLSEKDWTKMRGSPVAMVFQDPLSFLNPVMRIDRQIAESIRRHDPGENTSRRVNELLSLVKVHPGARHAYPHELSGGMRQRVLLAIALACRPRLLVADEPTTALDVTTQAEIMVLLRDLREQLGMSMLLISHDLGLVGSSCERIFVMYAGRTVENGSSADIMQRPLHPYTKGLFDSARALRLPNGRFATIGGDPPSLSHSLEGCPFRPRCALAEPVCTEMPPLSLADERRGLRCWVRARDLVPSLSSDGNHAV
jgi:oligopeptide/dipeptide ABC transporter ATP-binding protein